MRAALTRDAILAVTRELIVERGLDAVKLREVGRRLGVTAPALYAHVEDKSDLLRGVAEIEFGHLVARFEAITDPDPLERIRRASRVYVDYAIENPELWRVMFLFPPAALAGDASGAELAIASRAFDIPAAATFEAIDKGLFVDLDPLLLTMVTWVVAHGVASVLLLGIDLGPEQNDKLIDTSIETVLRGLRR